VRKFWRREAPGPSPVPSPDPVPVRPELAAWAQAVDATRLSDRTAKEAERYLRDYRGLHSALRREFGFRLCAAIAAQVSPPPPETVAPLDVMAVVLSARRKQLGLE
jgi:hypothetical protein